MYLPPVCGVCTPGAPLYGTSPVGLGANSADNYTAFGGW